VDPLAHHLLTEACNNAWANHRLLGACAQLSPADFDAPRSGFFPSIRATLNHIVAVDAYYLDAMQRSLAGEPPNPQADAFFAPAREIADAASLQREQAACDRRLIALCRSAVDAPGLLRREILVPRASGIHREPLQRLLAHLFQHQVHHRGQAHAMLSGTPVAPPQLDEFFCVNDAPLRAADFAALGFSETAIWPAE